MPYHMVSSILFIAIILLSSSSNAQDYEFSPTAGAGGAGGGDGISAGGAPPPGQDECNGIFVSYMLVFQIHVKRKSLSPVEKCNGSSMGIQIPTIHPQWRRRRAQSLESLCRVPIRRDPSQCRGCHGGRGSARQGREQRDNPNGVP